MTESKPASLPGPTIREFESLRFDPASFDHEAHVCVAWRYLQDFELLDAIARYRSTLKRLTSKLGIPEKYHETITWFYMIAVAEGAVGEARNDWPAFKAENPELFERNPSAIRRHYTNERLNSDNARELFLLPDVAI